ncbi:2-oxo acid dehydrogenase subunit E2 [Mycobacterium sp. MS1601]|uniref:2-oxo acid dehydrogenase subunit E2 n=1 Tax=Mycobacterium sp. MS1601 TaxID=1936029 RepID=UPI0012FC573F|nr:2-oxo acid dehydrogenase subunit E2 [Mycobacterium sp. MS1601]
MSNSVVLPTLGESVTEGTIARWLKSVGDHVAVDEPLVEVSTDKVDTEIPSPTAGILLEILAAEDTTVTVGDPIAIVGEPELDTTAPAKTAPDPLAPAVASPYRALRYTPLVRRLAAEHNVTLADLTGTGRDGRVRKQDVLAAAGRSIQPATAHNPTTTAAPAAPSRPAPPSPAPGVTGPERRVQLSRRRREIATQMMEALRSSAPLTTVIEVDVTNISRLCEQSEDAFLERHGIQLTFLPFVTKAVADTLTSHPMLNASLDLHAGEVVLHNHQNIAIAVDTETGLYMPVVREVGNLSVPGLARKIDDLTARARSRSLETDELTGGTFTITNTSSRGTLFDTPIINHPQVAVLGIGSVVKRPVVTDSADNLGETLAIRSMVYLSLTYDHQLLDGADAASFLSDLRTRLESGRFDA